MPILETIVYGDEKRTIGKAFLCPGCEFPHVIYTVKYDPNRDNPVWTWNGDDEKPTFTPSLMQREARPGSVCHLFVKDGRLEFLSDSTHALAGQTVDMVEFHW